MAPSSNKKQKRKATSLSPWLVWSLIAGAIVVIGGLVYLNFPQAAEYLKGQATGNYFQGGVFIAAGDVNGDGTDDIITGADERGGPHVKVFDGINPQNVLLSFFAYEPSFRGGVRVAAGGDFNGDGRADIVTAPGAGRAPLVKVFDGRTGEQIRSFLAYDQGFRGGVFVAAGYVDGDHRTPEIVTGPDRGGGPQVKVFSPTGTVLYRFAAYDSSFTGGVRVAVGDVISNDAESEIVTAPGRGFSPLIKVFDEGDDEARQFMAYAQAFTGGVYVAVDSELKTIITGAGQGGGPQVRVFNDKGSRIRSFFAYAQNFTGGVRVAAVDQTEDQPYIVATAPGSGTNPRVKVFDYSIVNPRLLFGFIAYPSGHATQSLVPIPSPIPVVPTPQNTLTDPKGNGPLEPFLWQ